MKIIDEAVKRMELLQLNSEVIKAFKEDGEIYCSECVAGECTLSKLSNHPGWLIKVIDIMKEYGITIYHIVCQKALYGEILDFLYVESEEENWKDSENEIRFGKYCDIYGMNLSEPLFSEFGSAQYQSCNGGLLKIR